MKKFEVDKVYLMVSPCDTNAIWKYQVIKKTEKTVTLRSLIDDEITRKKIHKTDTELCFPLGRYSMCPVLKATREQINN